MNNVIISNSEKIAELPKEEYIFKFCEEELGGIKKGYAKKERHNGIIVFILWGLLLAYYLYSDFYNCFVWFLVGAYVCLISLIIISTNKSNKKWTIDRAGVSQCTYEYKLFDEYMYIYIYRGGEEVRKSKIYYKEIIRMSMVDGYIVFELNQGAYFARCSDLNKDSHLYACLRKFKDNKKDQKIKKKK